MIMKIEVELQRNNLLKDNFKIKRGEKMRPKIIIYGVNEDLKEDELLSSLIMQNNFPENSELKYEFKMKNIRGSNIVLSLHHDAFNYIMKNRKVNILWERFNVREFLKPLQCFNCGRFGHMAKYCRLHKQCANCGSDEHDEINCTSEPQCSNCHSHNVRFKTDFDTKHGVRDKTCEVFDKEINNLRSRIDYGPSS